MSIMVGDFGYVGPGSNSYILTKKGKITQISVSENKTCALIAVQQMFFRWWGALGIDTMQCNLHTHFR